MGSQVAFFIAFHGNSTEISNEPAIQFKSLAKGSLSNTVKGRSELDFLQSQPLISLTVNQAVKRAPWNVYFPLWGPPVARPLAPIRAISALGATRRAIPGPGS